MGLDLALKRFGVQMVRTEVGDRYVVERMLRDGYNLGGEQSGHIVFLDHNTTGDGAMTCLQVLALMVEKNKRLSELKNVMKRLPQVLVNVRVREKREFDRMPRVSRVIAAVEQELSGCGRALIRYSGTELLARVMLEGEDDTRIRELARDIADAIGAEIGGKE
jgi:phosphoglucosamine mutase